MVSDEDPGMHEICEGMVFHRKWSGELWEGMFGDL
jgi:hypothetical protein